MIKNEEIFNWDDFLNKDDITQLEWEKASVMAAKWPTCAVGDQCKDIPRNVHGMPKSKTMQNLGVSFYRSIIDQEINKAKFYMQQIEIRSSQIINDLI